MKQPNDILNELREMNSPLADMSREMPYCLPIDYFEQLGNIVLEVINIEEPEAPVFGKEMPFSVPQGYFEELQDNITNTIALSGFAKENPLSVPAGYFENLPLAILNSVKEVPVKKKTNIISFGSTLILQQIKLAAAAILVIGIGMGMYKYNLDKRVPNISKALSEIPEYAINDYVNQHVDDVDAELILGTVETDTHASVKQLNEDEIIDYLNETGWEKDQSKKIENEQL